MRFAHVPAHGLPRMARGERARTPFTDYGFWKVTTPAALWLFVMVLAPESAGSYGD